MNHAELLYQALDSPFGVVVETNNPSRLRQKLYEVRKTNEIFTPLSFLISPFNPSDLWILNKGTQDE